ncbi:hypothetical protein GCM10010468_76480 [Actinocorallia longicatena]|uniref:Putative restriction endonuclease domain-containing protein n=1 Tax=Actinocorallia longicatena TaxID=111803 RepID=A0ABP6QMJ8_9ACTN
MKVAVEFEAGVQFELPDSALALWERGELHDLLNLPHDGTRVEIIDGKIVVTTAPEFGHNFIALELTKCLARTAAESTWEAVGTSGIVFPDALAGYIPDLVVVESSIYYAAAEAQVRRLTSDEIEMVVEVTSGGSAQNDRPRPKSGGGKWEGYVSMEIPYYLLIDRDPKVRRTTLYSVPDPARQIYALNESWAFGETISLPEPFNLEIPTSKWYDWQ